VSNLWQRCGEEAGSSGRSGGYRRTGVSKALRVVAILALALGGVALPLLLPGGARVARGAPGVPAASGFENEPSTSIAASASESAPASESTAASASTKPETTQSDDADEQADDPLPATSVEAPSPSVSAAPSSSAIAPLDAPTAAPKEQDSTQRPLGVLRVLVGLAATVVLAIAAAHPRVRRIENRFGLTIAIASGLPFILLGYAFQHPAIGVLDRDLLRALGPFVEFGLGWVGFVLGLEFDVRKLDDLPDGIGSAIAAESLIPFLFAAAMAIGALQLLGPSSGGLVERNALLVGACAALSAATAPLALARGAGRTVARILDRIAQLDDIFALVVLLFIGAWYRPVTSVGWQLPAIAWLFLTVGLGGVLGMLSYALIRGAKSGAEELALTLGAVAFSAGVTGRLALPPLVVCAVAGALLANLPRKRRGTQLANTLRTVERPVVLLFMLIAGATAPFDQWQGWALMPAFLLARTAGKVLGARAAKKFGPAELRGAPGIELALLPQSPMAIATMLSAWSLYSGAIKTERVLGWLFTAVIIGSYFNDVIVQIIATRVNDLTDKQVEDAAKSIHPEASAFDEQSERLESVPAGETEGRRIGGTPMGFTVPKPPKLPENLGPTDPDELE
jgi:hypothetical protein